MLPVEGKGAVAPGVRVKALALDFDGVLADSAHECFEVALRTFAELLPESPFAELPPGAQPEAGESPARTELFRRFVAAMPLGNRAEDFGVALASLAQGAPLPDQAAYDAYRATLPPPWIDAFHERFYVHRSAFFAADPEAWLALNPPFVGFLEVLRTYAGRAPYAIATAKDRGSVRRLLEAWGVDELFPESLVLDKEVGESKVAHLQHIQVELDVPFGEIVFVDDKVNHLEAVSHLGVGCGLAAWGYNGPREHARARAQGFRVLRLEEAGGLFGAP